MYSGRTYTGVEDFPMGLEGYMLGCQNRKKLLKLSPGNISGDDGKLASSTSTQHVSKVAKVCFNVD